MGNALLVLQALIMMELSASHADLSNSGTNKHWSVLNAQRDFTTIKKHRSVKSAHQALPCSEMELAMLVPMARTSTESCAFHVDSNSFGIRRLWSVWVATRDCTTTKIRKPVKYAHQPHPFSKVDHAMLAHLILFTTEIYAFLVVPTNFGIKKLLNVSHVPLTNFIILSHLNVRNALQISLYYKTTFAILAQMELILTELSVFLVEFIKIGIWILLNAKIVSKECI